MKKQQVKTTLKQNKVVTSRGADPEFFIKNTETGEIEGAIELLKRGKEDPIDLGDGVTLYYDNLMGEFTVKPAFSRGEFVKSISDAVTKINKYIKENCGEKYEMCIQASHEFDKKYMSHPDALRVGCNPEFNADELMMITPPDFSGNLRSSGGHLAQGRQDFASLNSEDFMMKFDDKIDFVRLLDYLVGLPFTLIDNDPTSTRRRKIYGSPSSHRPKDEFAGIEYRVLSNFWINSPKLVELIYDLSEYAFELLLARKHERIFAIDKNLVNAAIKENNKGLADEILATINLPKSFQTRLNQYRNVTAWNFCKEWGLNNQIASRKFTGINNL